MVVGGFVDGGVCDMMWLVIVVELLIAWLDCNNLVCQCGVVVVIR